MARAFYFNVDLDPKTDKIIFEFRKGDEIDSFFMRRKHVFNILNRRFKVASRGSKLVDVAIEGWYYEAELVFFYVEQGEFKQVRFKAWPAFYIVADTIRDPFNIRRDYERAAAN